jgi:membrane-associated phospholipid phosphatase
MLFEYIQLLSRKLVDFIYGIGYFGEQIAFFLTLFLIYPSYPKLYSYVFVIISLLNKAVNEYLKAEIQEPRPVDSQKFLASETFKRFSYGMPSGHTQGVGFALVYSYLLTHAHIVEFAVFALFVIYERYVF